MFQNLASILARGFVSGLSKVVLLTVLVLLSAISSSEAKAFHCRSGDVTCLINAITAANATPQSDKIMLAAGIYNLSKADNNTDGPNGLPSITTKIEIIGKGPDKTVIQKDPALGFNTLRIIHVAQSGDLTINGVAIKGGINDDNDLQGAGGVFSRGSVRIIDSRVSENFSTFGPAGVENEGGTMIIADSFIIDNFTIQGRAGGIVNNSGTISISRTTIVGNCGESAGGIWNRNEGQLEITESAITRNGVSASDVPGRAIVNAGVMTITNTSIIENGVCRLALPFTAAETSLELFSGNAISNFGGNVTVMSSTIARNVPDSRLFAIGGIFSSGGTVKLQNTILAENTDSDVPGDCFSDDGGIVSLGNNLFGNITDCDIDLLESDLIGNAGLGIFTDDGTPGNGHIPLLTSSRAINRGDDDSCPKRDQIGNKRKEPCDIGAVEAVKTRGYGAK